jgi:hypothetical protein
VTSDILKSNQRGEQNTYLSTQWFDPIERGSHIFLVADRFSMILVYTRRTRDGLFSEVGGHLGLSEDRLDVTGSLETSLDNFACARSTNVVLPLAPTGQ